MDNVQKGHYYEEMAAEYLSAQGYQILHRNYRCRQAEIDIIAMEGSYLVFVEVKYRKSDRVQHPLAAVDKKKQQHISRAAMQYLYSHGYGQEQPCRFDVVAILEDGPVLYKNAFSYQGTKGW